MPNSILVPLDGSVLAEHALPYALSWAGHADAREIVLARVTAPTPGVMTSMEEHCLEYLEGVAASLRRLTSIPCRCLVRTGRPNEALLGLIESEQPALLAMTSHGFSGWKKLLLGSVAQLLARRATCPVLIVRGTAAQSTGRPDLTWRPTFEPVLVPVDSTRSAERALLYCSLRGHLTTRLVLMRATDARFGFDPQDEPARKALIAQITQDLGRLRERFQAQIADLETEIQEDHAAEAILRSAAMHKTGLIVMAASSRPLLERTLLGSTVEKILHHSECPVLMLPSEASIAAPAPTP